MNSIMQFYCQGPIMNGLGFVFMTLSLLRTTIMLFIRYAPNCGFVRKNHQKRTRLKKTLQTMLPSDRVLQHQYQVWDYQNYADLIRDLLQAEKHDELTIKNHHQHHVGAAPLPEIHHNEKKPNFPKDNNPKKNGRSARRRRNRQKIGSLKRQWKRMVLLLNGVMCSVMHVVVSSILLKNVVHPST
jgi:hypothetical protein